MGGGHPGMSCDSHLTLVIPYRMDKMMESVGLYSSVHVGKIPVSVAEAIKVQKVSR